MCISYTKLCKILRYFPRESWASSIRAGVSRKSDPHRWESTPSGNVKSCNIARAYKMPPPPFTTIRRAV